MKKLFYFVVIPIVILGIVYLSGPQPETPVYNKTMPDVPTNPMELEAYISTQEAQHRLKMDNEARIIWTDSTKKKTPFSVVYLHGFSASQEEGDPVHVDFAKKFGCNLFLPRLSDHGVDTTEQLLYVTPDRLWASAKESLAIGKAIGEKVILMSTSTGGSLAFMLAADYPQDVFALINLSPNIAINNPAAFLLNKPWGLQIARTVIGGKYNVSEPDSLVDAYWNTNYRLEAAVELQELLVEMNKSTFERVTCPSLTLYYYKNEKEQDPTVKVSAMLEMNKQLGTPDDMKETVPVPAAGAHVIGSYIKSKDLPTVERAVEKFAVEKLKMVPFN